MVRLIKSLSVFILLVFSIHATASPTNSVQSLSGGIFDPLENHCAIHLEYDGRFMAATAVNPFVDGIYKDCSVSGETSILNCDYSQCWGSWTPVDNIVIRPFGNNIIIELINGKTGKHIRSMYYLRPTFNPYP